MGEGKFKASKLPPLRSLPYSFPHAEPPIPTPFTTTVKKYITIIRCYQIFLVHHHFQIATSFRSHILLGTSLFLGNSLSMIHHELEGQNKYGFTFQLCTDVLTPNFLCSLINVIRLLLSIAHDSMAFHKLCPNDVYLFFCIAYPVWQEHHYMLIRGPFKSYFSIDWVAQYFFPDFYSMIHFIYPYITIYFHIFLRKN